MGFTLAANVYDFFFFFGDTLYKWIRQDLEVKTLQTLGTVEDFRLSMIAHFLLPKKKNDCPFLSH